MSSNETRQYFDSVADQWDQMRRTFFGEGVRVAAIRAANISPGSIVANVGTGTGFIADAALTAGARVIAIDSSPEMLAQM
jgi:ubiquinone/menaquinone biosynthesis C-methylase UbiE